MSRIRLAALCSAVPAAFAAAACTPLFDGPKPVDVRPVMTNTAGNGDADDLLYRSAAAAIGDRDYNRALDYLQAAREKQPRDVRVLNAFGVVYDKLGRFDLSARYYAQAKVVEPKSTIVAGNIAYSQLLQGLRKDDASPVELASSVPAAHASVGMTGDGDAHVSAQSNKEAPASILPSATVLEPIKPEVLAAAIPQPQLRFAPDAPAIARASSTVAETQTTPVIPLGLSGHLGPLPPAFAGAGSSPLTRLAGDDSVGRPADASAKADSKDDNAKLRASADAPTAPQTKSTMSQVQTSSVIPGEHDRVSDRAREGDPGSRVSTPLKISNETVLREVVPPPHLGPLRSPLTRLGDDSVGRTTASPSALRLPETKQSTRPGEASAKTGARNDGAKANTSQRQPMLTGHPLVIVNASGQKAATERLRRRLAHLGWTVPRSSARDAAGQRATTLYYPQRILAAARGLARTLRISVLLAPRTCNCGGLELVIGADILNRIAQIEDLDNPGSAPSLRTKVKDHGPAKT
jgi:hypothetical protein